MPTVKPIITTSGTSTHRAYCMSTVSSLTRSGVNSCFRQAANQLQSQLLFRYHFTIRAYHLKRKSRFEKKCPRSAWAERIHICIKLHRRHSCRLKTARHVQKAMPNNLIEWYVYLKTKICICSCFSAEIVSHAFLKVVLINECHHKSSFFFCGAIFYLFTLSRPKSEMAMSQIPY